MSGTTNGFVLADIADIAASTDSYVTGGTFNDLTDIITLNLNLGKPSVTITGITSAIATGMTWNPNQLTVGSSDGSSVSTLIESFSALTINGPLTVTGDTILENVTATTIDASTISSGGTDLATLISATDTYATGYTYTPSTNTLEITGNNVFNSLSATINSFTGLTLANLTAGRVPYVGTGGLLTDEAGFTYDDGTNTLGAVDLSLAGDAVIQGSLTVFGPSISAFTSQLYVEDDNITLNYNPTGSTVSTSVGAGWTIQDGNGISSGDVNLDIVRLQNLTGLTATEIPDVSEYTALTGYANRGWITQLNDIVIRSTDVSDGGSAGDITGVRVLAEFDVLDGGSY